MLVRNDGDERLDGDAAEALVRRLVAPERLVVRTIPASAGLIHDIVTPEDWGENAARIGEAYRYLSDALGIALAGSARDAMRTVAGHDASRSGERVTAAPRLRAGSFWVPTR